MTDTERALEYFKETFNTFKEEHQKYLDSKFNSIYDMTKTHDSRIKDLENDRVKRHVYSGASGFVGGFIAALGKGVFWK